MEVIVGDYSSQNPQSLLARCEAVRSDYDGMLHSGIIHYVQSQFDGSFVLKAAIQGILDKCPSVWPEDLPERIDADETVKLTDEQQREWQELNAGLLVPVDGSDIVEVIRLAKRFLAEQDSTKEK